MSGRGPSAGWRCATRWASTSRSCASRSVTRTSSTSSASSRSGRTASSRSSTSSRRTSSSRTRRSTSSAGASRRRRSGSCGRTASGSVASTVPEGDQRLFVAVPLSPEAVAACASLIDAVRHGPLGRVPRWVQVGTLHLTVRFLGATAAERVAEVGEAVVAAADGVAPFEVELAGAGAFPDEKRPRTLWLGIERGAAELGALAMRLNALLTPLGFAPDDRPYRPHLIVARLDAAPRADGGAVAQALEAAAAGWRTAFSADELVLFRSHLGGGPPRHEPVRRVALSA